MKIHLCNENCSAKLYDKLCEYFERNVQNVYYCKQQNKRNKKAVKTNVLQYINVYYIYTTIIQ